MAAPMGSKVFLGTFSLFSFEELHHPLHLGVSADDLDTVVDSGKDVIPSKSPIVAISRKQCSLSEGGKDQSALFASLQPLASGQEPDSVLDRCNTSDTREPDLQAITLYCTRVFLDRYGFSEHDQIYLKLTQLFPIHKVVLEAQNKTVFSWAKQQFFSTGLLLSVCQGEVLIRRGDPFLAPCCSLFQTDPGFSVGFLLNLRVLDCDPLAQGALTINTKVVIIQAAEMDVAEDTETGEEAIKPALVSSFALQSQPSAKSKRRAVLEQQWNSNQQMNRPWKTDAGVVYWREIPTSGVNLNNVDCSLETIDIHNTLFISKHQAFKSGIFHGSFVELKLCECELSSKQDKSTTLCKLPDGKNGLSAVRELNGVVSIQDQMCSKNGAKKTKPNTKLANTRLACVCILECQAGAWFDSCKTLIQPTLLLNLAKNVKGNRLTKQAEIQIQRFQRNTSSETELSSSWHSDIPFASEVHLSSVNSPDYSTGSSFNTVLHNYFSVPRLLQLGDILCVDTEGDAEFHQDLTDGTEIRRPTVYFKVTRILPKSHGHRGTFLADISHTTVFQDGAVHSYVPSVMSQLDRADPPGLDSSISRLQDILKPYLTSRGQCEELYPSILLTGNSGCGKTAVCKSVAVLLNMHYYQINCHELCGETSAATEARIKNVIQRATTYAPCALVLKNIECLGKDRDGNTDDPRVSGSFQSQILKLHEDCTEWPVVVIATTSASKHLNADMHDTFLHHINIEVPNEERRREMLKMLMQGTASAADVNIAHLAQRTAGMVLGDLCALLCHAKRKAFHRAKSLSGHTEMSWQDEADLCLAGFSLKQQDCEAALDELQAAHSDAIGAPKIPNVTWDDIGGLASVKAEILDTIQLPLQHPELFAAGLRRSGVLLYGPPGTGKTLLAKAVATECSLNFLSVKGPELINMYVGQSEENVREVFNRARSAAPCVIFFDELDSLAPNRGRSGDSGGVMDRVVSQLLAELDGLHKSCDVFVIGATNRPDLLDPALLRPGRFDKLLYLGVSADNASQLNIIKALTRKFELGSGCSLEKVVDNCPHNMTGADFYALCSDAMLSALKHKIDQLEAGEVVDQRRVCVSQEDFQQALNSLVPSVSDAELLRFQSIQQHFAVQK